MALVVNTNIASMNAQRSLAANTNDMKQAMERLSTGKKINSAADDAAGFAIAETMTSQVRGLSMAAKNASDGLGLLKVVENATNDVTDMLQRVRELAVQAKSNTNGDSDVQRLQDEAEALFEEITRVSDQTQYNGKAYLGGEAATGIPGTGFINIQVGYKDNETIKLLTHDISADQLGTVTRVLADGTVENVNAVGGPDGNRLHTLASAATVDQQHKIQGVGTFGAQAEYKFTYAGTTLSTTAFAASAPADANALVTALTTESANATAIATAGAAWDIAFTTSAGDIHVEWTGNGALPGYIGDHITDADWATWSTHTQGSVQADGVAESYLDIKSENALTVISDAIAQVAGYKAAWGASQNRLEYTISNLMNVVEFTAAARSRIQDADFAVEAANLAKAQVLQQTGAAMLAQANAAPQLALQLLK